MAAKVSLDDLTLEQLQQVGELRVEDSHGVPLVLMTIDARQQLGKAIYDDSDLTIAELKSQGAELLADPEEWGDPAMDVYDTMESIDSDSHANS